MPVVLKVIKDDAPLERDTGSRGEEEVNMTEQATQGQEKAPEVHVKKAPKRQPKADHKPSAATIKLLEQLTEVGKEIERLEGLKNDRTALVVKLTAAKVPTATIAKAASLSVARTRQVQAKAK
jgi:hypothetical protein